MSRIGQSRQILAPGTTLGGVLRQLREDRGLPLWKAAYSAEMDSTLLSKIELDQRLPTPEQTAALAKYFGVDLTELESMRIAQKFLDDNGHKPAAIALALSRIQEATRPAPVNNKRTVVNYRTNSVKKSKKKS
jgi:transcriptional regulator with XRE-family HTH domain